MTMRQSNCKLLYAPASIRLPICEGRTCLLISSASTEGEGPSHACGARYSISTDWSFCDVFLMRIWVVASCASVSLNVSASACQCIRTHLNACISGNSQHVHGLGYATPALFGFKSCRTAQRRMGLSLCVTCRMSAKRLDSKRATLFIMEGSAFLGSNIMRYVNDRTLAKPSDLSVRAFKSAQYSDTSRTKDQC